MGGQKTASTETVSKLLIAPLWQAAPLPADPGPKGKSIYSLGSFGNRWDRDSTDAFESVALGGGQCVSSRLTLDRCGRAARPHLYLYLLIHVFKWVHFFFF